MTARHIGRPDPASHARLQVILIALAAWNLLTFALSLVETRFLEVGGVEGVLGGRAMAGSSAVLAIAYLYAARNPVRHRFVLWLATLEQFIALFASTFHWARGDLGGSEALLPIAMSAIFLVLLITNLPRQTDTV
jgi:hypothetical protein